MCEYKNCAFKVLHNLYERNDISTQKNRCIFHLSKQNKKQFSLQDREEFKEAIQKYIDYKKLRDYKIEFENVVFLNVDWNKLLSDVKENNIIFKNCTFLENTRFDNIKCESLEFDDCRFLDGGGIKNRDVKDNLNINKLVLHLYELQGDFVVDIGKYANNDGDIELNTGTIKNIEFSNHQVGDGRVFFVGLNEKLENGDFRNRILDKVVFENCDLTNCYFLNSKVDKTEFRNIEFPFVENEKIIKDQIKINIILFLIFLLFIGLYIYINYFFIDLIISIGIVIFVLFLISLLDDIYIVLLSKIKPLIDNKNEKNNTLLNSRISTADEYKIIKNIKNKSYEQKKENVKSLKDLYEQFAINFSYNDKQLSGEFTYGSKFYKSMSFFGIRDAFEVSINQAHHFINGYGQRWFRALWWFISILLIFSWIFTDMIKPNENYISTPNTPTFLIGEGCDFNITKYNKNNFNLYSKTDFVKNKNIYAYDNRYDFNFSNQYILCLKKDFKVGFYKSISNIFYPFSLESKKWFQNVSEVAVTWSFIETMLLWLTLIAMFKALWNRIKF